METILQAALDEGRSVEYLIQQAIKVGFSKGWVAATDKSNVIYPD
jgi:hypothetical protein